MVRFLECKGQELPIRVSYYALKKMKQSLGRTVSLTDSSDYDAYEELLYHSLVKGHKEEGIEMPFKREDMEDVMDEVYFDFIALIPFFFQTKEEREKAKAEGQDDEKK